MLGVALLATLVGASDVGKVAGVVRRLNPVSALAFVGLMIVYESVRGVQWHLLLKGLRVRVPVRAEVFSYLWGEASKAAPAGNYLQNYLLGHIEGEDFARTSAATTLIVLTEIGCGLLIVGIIQIDDWTWLRPLILVSLAVLVIVAGVASRLWKNAGPPDWMTRRHRITSPIFESSKRLGEGIAALAEPQLLARQAVLCASYIIVAGFGLYVLMIGLSVNQVSYWQALGVYAFTMTVGLLMPLPIDVGVIEISGVGALLAIGVSQEVAVAIMLLNRVLNIGSAVAIASLGTLAFRHELRKALNASRPAQAEAEGTRSTIRQ